MSNKRSKRSVEEVENNGENDAEETVQKKTKGKAKVEEEEVEDEVDDDVQDEEVEEEEETGEEEEEEEEEDDDEEEDDGQPKKPFTAKSFVILKTDFDDENNEAPIWKIDGCSLLQKYVPEKDAPGKLYKSTSVYSGWSIKNKDKYYAAPVELKKNDCGDQIVELKRSQLLALNEAAAKD